MPPRADRPPVAVELRLRHGPARRLVHAPPRHPRLRLRTAVAGRRAGEHARRERLLPRARRALDAHLRRLEGAEPRALRGRPLHGPLRRPGAGAVARRARASRGELRRHRHARRLRGRRDLVRRRGAGRGLDRGEARRLPHAARARQGDRAKPLARVGRCDRRRPEPADGRIRPVAVRGGGGDGRGGPPLREGRALPAAGAPLGQGVALLHEQRRGDPDDRPPRVPEGLRAAGRRVTRSRAPTAPGRNGARTAPAILPRCSASASTTACGTS